MRCKKGGSHKRGGTTVYTLIGGKDRVSKEKAWRKLIMEGQGTCREEGREKGERKKKVEERGNVDWRGGDKEKGELG